jgi:hypothetical protein
MTITIVLNKTTGASCLKFMVQWIFYFLVDNVLSVGGQRVMNHLLCLVSSDSEEVFIFYQVTLNLVGNIRPLLMLAR